MLRQSNNALKVNVLQAIGHLKPLLNKHLFISAYSDGTVYLQGYVPTRADHDALERLIQQVNGVTHVFCNVATEN
jgi:hypothetical protein